MTARYHIHVFYSDEDGSFVAEVPYLDGVSALGAAPHEAVPLSQTGSTNHSLEG